MKQQRRLHRPSLLALLFAVAALTVPSAALADVPEPSTGGAPSGHGVSPEVLAGNPKCPDQFFELKIDPPANGTYTGVFGLLHVTVAFTDEEKEPKLVDWESNLGIDQVIVKGGDWANLYEYEPEGTDDANLHTPVNPESGKYYGISFVTFCYDFELEVEKSAMTTFTRDYDWEIEKSNEAPELTLDPGEQSDVPYEVTAGVKGSEDKDWVVSGEITVHNPSPFDAVGVEVTDEITEGIVASVDCGGEEEIPAGAAIVCTYEGGLPDGTERINEATATTTTPKINDGSGTAAVTFGEPSKLVDECVDVEDAFDEEAPEQLGQACVPGSPETFEYERLVGGYSEEECGTHLLSNTASLEEEEGEGAEATSSVEIEVPCPEEEVAPQALSVGPLALTSGTAYFKPCGTFKFKGGHKVFRHSLSCAKAKHKSKYVLKRRKAPRGWRCYLRKLRKGSATCRRGGKAFSFRAVRPPTRRR